MPTLATTRLGAPGRCPQGSHGRPAETQCKWDNELEMGR
jgi:hypothetical protein